MDELNQKLSDIIRRSSGIAADNILEEIHVAFKAEGYVHIPTTKGRNVTVYSTDSDDDPLLTEQEWREKFNIVMTGGNRG